MIGLTQTFTGIGMLCGPVIGSFLYEAGGFMLPFFVCGGLLFTLTIPIWCLLPDDMKEEKEQPKPKNTKLEQIEEYPESRENDDNNSEVNISFFGVLCQFEILAGALCMSASLMCLTFKEPLLQLRLKEEKMSTWLIGIVFSMDTITYSITSFVLNWVP